MITITFYKFSNASTVMNKKLNDYVFMQKIRIWEWLKK